MLCPEGNGGDTAERGCQSPIVAALRRPGLSATVRPLCRSASERQGFSNRPELARRVQCRSPAQTPVTCAAVISDPGVLPDTKIWPATGAPPGRQADLSLNLHVF